MKNLRVSVKLIIGFMIVTMLSVLLAAIGVFSGVSTNGNYTYLLEQPSARERSLREVQLQFTMMRYRAANFAMEAGNADIITGTLTPQYESAYQLYTEKLNEYLENNTNDPRREQALKDEYNGKIASLKSLAEQFDVQVQIIRDQGLAGDSAGATTTLRDIIPLTNEINALIDELVQPALELVQSESANMDRVSFMYTIALISITAVCAIASVILALYISRLISKPLVVLSAFMQRAGSTGDINLTQHDHDVIGKYGKFKDETGETIGNTATFINHVNNVSDILGAIANGDLTPEIKLLSETDTMGLSLKKMLENLNNMFGEIHNSTAQVSTGAKQIADGSQALAQGSTEQAASVEELSSSITEIAEQTKTNAAMAEKAATLANTIKANAEKGSHQMDEMTDAVREINTASQNISKVIKSIEDIAFQTNILALNASVEAARAGQHGKGFAVVAEEVRNLATKSSEAAKDTGILIANSVEKAELGARIADETASSLTEIVAGINESSLIVTEIAKSSEEQSLGIMQINKGIDQVAQVVQQNSATAEESAAASEEMSGQSVMLEELIAQFKLRDAGNARLSSGGGTKKQIAMPGKTAYAPNGDFGKY